MFKQILALIAAFFVLLGLPASILAAPYGGGLFGECKFSEGCDEPVIISQPATPPPPSGPETVSRDIDNDSKLETASDTNSDSTDGFEDFADADSSSAVLVDIDGDEDGKIDFIINTDDDSFPERYWDPDNDILSTVQLADCDGDGAPEWRFDVGSETKVYDPDTAEFLDRCQSPSQPGANPGSTGSNSGGGNKQVKSTRITNAVPFLADNPVYQSIGRAVAKVPAPVAYSFPYLLLLIILLLVLRLIVQSKHEVTRLLVATKAQEAEKRLALEKANFVMLSSHYLRTPITVIRGNIELMQSLNQITAEVGKTLETAGQILLNQVSSLLNRLDEDKKLAVIPSGQQATIKTFISPRLVLPVIVIVALLLLGQFILIDFRVVSPNIVNMLVQIALVVLLVQTFLSKLRQRQLNRHNRLDQERVLQEQRVLDAARSEFITGVANDLETQLVQFRQQLGSVIEQKEAAKVKNALNQLEGIVAKFRLVAFLQGQQLQAGKVNFGLRDTIEATLKSYIEPAKVRGITITPTIQDGQLYQQPQLIGIVLKSLLDNAIKYSPDGGTVEISAANNHGKAEFSVRDHGQGIPKDRQDLLFKPFSRTDSAETFDTEGLGFSLYLDKVITNYLRGDINVDSSEGTGTKVTLTVPASL